MKDIQSALTSLRAKGYKLTHARKQVLSVLAQAHDPLSPYDIQRILEQEDEHLNHVTIYRVLGLLCQLNLAHKVLSLGGFVKCTLGEKGKEGCHRFMLCRECGALYEFADKALCAEEDEIARCAGFRTEQHFSEFSGLCANCQN